MIHHRSLFKEAAMLSTHVNEPLLELRYKKLQNFNDTNTNLNDPGTEMVDDS